MIEYAKHILPKVSEWEDLFRKELIKCIHWEEDDKLDVLFCWCYENFGHTHAQILFELFGNISMPLGFPILVSEKKDMFLEKKKPMYKKEVTSINAFTFTVPKNEQNEH